MLASHALLVAHLHEFRRDQIDDVVDLFDQFMGELMRKGERAQEQHVLQHAKTMNAYLWRFADGLEAFLQALADDRDPSLALLQELRVPDDSGTTFSGQPPAQVGSSCFGTEATYIACAYRKRVGVSGAILPDVWVMQTETRPRRIVLGRVFWDECHAEGSWKCTPIPDATASYAERLTLSTPRLVWYNWGR